MLALTAQQQAEVCRLRDEKYKSWAWTWGKDPAFTCCREGRLGDAPIRLAYRARHGIFSGVEVHCPLLDEAEAVRLLEGARLDLPEPFRRLPPPGRRAGRGAAGTAAVREAVHHLHSS